MTVSALLAAVHQLCHAYARAEVSRTLAGYTDDPARRALDLEVAQHWDGAVRHRFEALNSALNDLIPDVIHAETFLPVRPLSTGDVHLHLRDQQARTVLVRFTAAEAVAVGAHLTAYAALGLDRTGGKVAAVLPPIDHPLTTATEPPAPPPPVVGVPATD